MIINEQYKKIIQAVQDDKISDVQALVISVNSLEDLQSLKSKIQNELILFSSCLSSPIKSTVKINKEPYLHGFISIQCEKGELFRYTFTCLPTHEQTFITLYGTNGEIRYDSNSKNIKSYIQIPDYVGDDLTYQGNIDIELDKGIVGAKLLTNKEIDFFKNLINFD